MIEKGSTAGPAVHFGGPPKCPGLSNVNRLIEMLPAGGHPTVTGEPPVTAREPRALPSVMISSRIKATLVVFAILACSLRGNAADSRAELAPRLNDRIKAFHAGAPTANHHLRLVYFHPNDAPPQKDYQSRLTRIMLDIQDFYRVEMERNGFGAKTFPLEMDGARPKIHMVRGREPSNGYDYDSKYGAKILGEMKQALKGVIDFEREFVLVFCGLCEKSADGEYRFHSPYYGWGGSGQQKGLCFAADGEMLDTNFTNTTDRVVYREHLGKFTRTVAAFNTLYIGGIAHELGHGLGLPHNGQKPWEKQSLGTALMGSGNFTYRKEQWGDKGSFMTRASAMRLATHPLFTQSDRQRFSGRRMTIDELKFSRSEKTLRIAGRINASPEAMAVIAYTDPDGGSDYDAHTWIGEVKEGRFSIDARFHRPGKHSLRLTICHLNGDFSTVELPYDVDKAQKADAAGLNMRWVFNQAEDEYMSGRKSAAAKLARNALKDDSISPMFAKFRHLIELASDPEPTDLSRVKAKEFFLSDARWAAAKVGWAQPARNQYFSGPGVRNGVCLELGDQFFPKGIYAHAPSRYAYDLNGDWKTFTATVGLHRGAHGEGTSVFIVKGDGKVLAKSDLLRGSKTAEIRVDISGVKTLELIAASGKQGNAVCWSIWGAPKVSR